MWMVFDYYKAAIECYFGTYELKLITNMACTGIYFHCKQNERLGALSEEAKTAKWCIKNTIVKDDFDDAIGNADTSNSGYFIYFSDHRISLKDCVGLNNIVIKQYTGYLSVG